MKDKLYIQYGCGLSAPKHWVNYDASPTLRIQKSPLIGAIAKSKLNPKFPKNVHYGDIIKGLPIPNNSCDGVFCSHTLEHLTLADFRTALKNTYKIMKGNALFRCIVPDLEWSARKYIRDLDSGHKDASIEFIQTIALGRNQRPKGLKEYIISFFGNSHHLWMWDRKSLILELEKAGFRNIRICEFGDSHDKHFKYVEEKRRFINSVAIECQK